MSRGTLSRYSWEPTPEVLFAPFSPFASSYVQKHKATTTKNKPFANNISAEVEVMCVISSFIASSLIPKLLYRHSDTTYVEK